MKIFKIKIRNYTDPDFFLKNKKIMQQLTFMYEANLT